MTIEPIMTEGRSSPRLETERLILRMFTAQDFEPLFEINSNPATFRFSERDPLARDEAWARLLRNIGHWSVNDYGLFAVEEKNSGRLIGEAGLADFRRGLGPVFDAVPEASWTIAPPSQLQGFATEAMQAVLNWAKGVRGVQRTVCLIHARNEPSLNVAAKLGYRAFQDIVHRNYPALLFERTG